MSDHATDWLDLKDAAREKRMSYQELWKLVAEKKVRAKNRNPGGKRKRWVVSLSGIDDYFESLPDE